MTVMDRTTHKKWNSGMTMAEMMITVAIIIILAAVAFVSLIQLQRTLAQRERDTIAKEIFVTAQNHLSMARGEGYLGKTNASDYGTTVGDVNIFVVNAGDNSFHKNDSDKTVLDMMLPFGSIDESVRTGGNYVICYQVATGRVTDVFYCSDSGTPDKFNHDFVSGEYSDKLAGLANDDDESKKDRRTYSYGLDTAAVLGWYGGTGLEKLGYELEKPRIEVKNEDKLYVIITDDNFSNSRYAADGLCLKLILTGETSGAKMAISIKRDNNQDSRQSDVGQGTTCTYVLDDITQPHMHFADLTAGKEYFGNYFIYGENIKVEAVAYSNAKLATVVYSDPWTPVNSLFDGIDKVNTDPAADPLGKDPSRVASVANFRHLENLDPQISGLGKNGQEQSVTGRIMIPKAVQTADLVWNDTTSIFKDGCYIYRKGLDSSEYQNYYPVTPMPAVFTDYDGNRHYIQDVKITHGGGDSNAYAGLFAAMTGVSIENLELIDFSVEGGVNSGVLAGSLSGTSNSNGDILVSNVVAYNKKTDDNGNVYYVTNSVEGSGATGGLIGQLTDGTVEKSAAAVKVTSTDGSAGGLIGSASNVKLDMCYSGGHTEDGEYVVKDSDGNATYNVTSSSGNAGGLVGTLSGSADYCYSTCSVKGKTAGGFAGSATGNIKNSYSTGRVSGNDNNAFIGSGSPTVTGCSFFEIINSYTDSSGELQYKEAGVSGSGISKIDGSINTYNNFIGSPSSWEKAKPYDSFLSRHYKHNGEAAYCLKTVAQLANTSIPDTPEIFVTTHYGDWPSPELLFVNSKN